MGGSSAQEHVGAEQANPGGDAKARAGPDVVPVDVVHELSNLLTIILGGLERLRRQALDESGRRHLDQVQAAADQAGRLLHKYVGPSAIDAPLEDGMGAPAA